MGKEDRHNGKQSNSTRLELFIALKYLLERCSGKKNLSKTIELTKYAEDNFKVYLDRRRANSILQSLEELTNKYPGVLPYKVVKDVKTKRYYLLHTLYGKRLIETIVKSIRSDTCLSQEGSDELIDIFLSKICSIEDKDRIISKVKKQIQTPRHISDEMMDQSFTFEDLRDKEKIFFFRLNKMLKPIDCTDFEALREVSKLRKAERDKSDYYTAGIVYGVYTFIKKIEVCIYLPDVQAAFITDVKNIVFNNQIKPVAIDAPMTYRLPKARKYSSIDDWIENYYRGNTGYQYDIVFRFSVGESKTVFNQISNAFEEHFKKPMEYETRERILVFRHDEGEEVIKRNFKEITVKVRSNYNSFESWFWNYGVFKHITVLEPKRFNNRLLSSITARFTRTLERYGENEEERMERLHRAIE